MDNLLSTILVSCVLISKVLSDCCGHADNNQCEDCTRRSLFSCCGKNNCNMFCCNCVCITPNPCKFRCALRDHDRKKRTIDTKTKLPKNVTQIIRLLDTNSDGKIELNEAFAWFKLKISRNVTSDYITQAFKKMDVNNDNYLTADEIDPPMPLRIKRSSSSDKNKSRSSSSPCFQDTDLDMALFLIRKKGLPDLDLFSSNIKSSEHVHMKMITGVIDANTKMCGLEISIVYENGKTVTQQFPEQDLFKCTTVRSHAYRISLTSPGYLYTNWIHDTTASNIKKIRIRALSYSPALIHGMLITLDPWVIGKRYSPISILLHQSFFKACACSIDKPRPAFKRAMFNQYIRLSRGLPGISTIEINDVQEYVKIRSSPEFNGDPIVAAKLIERLCYTVSVYEATNACKDIQDGCDCNGLGLVKASSCSKTNLFNVMLTAREVIDC